MTLKTAYKKAQKFRPTKYSYHSPWVEIVTRNTFTGIRQEVKMTYRIVCPFGVIGEGENWEQAFADAKIEKPVNPYV